MNIPGFTAEASLCRTGEHRMTTTQRKSDPHVIQPAFGCGPCICHVACRSTSRFSCQTFCYRLCGDPYTGLVAVRCSPWTSSGVVWS